MTSLCCDLLCVCRVSFSLWCVGLATLCPTTSQREHWTWFDGSSLERGSDSFLLPAKLVVLKRIELLNHYLCLTLHMGKVTCVCVLHCAVIHDVLMRLNGYGVLGLVAN